MNIVSIPQQVQPAGRDGASASAKKDDFESRLDNAVKSAGRQEQPEKADNGKQSYETKNTKAEKPQEKSEGSENSNKPQDEAQDISQVESSAPEQAATQKEVVQPEVNDADDTNIAEEEQPQVRTSAEVQMLLAQIVPAPMLVQNIVEANNAGQEIVPEIAVGGQKNPQFGLQLQANADAGSSDELTVPVDAEPTSAGNQERPKALGKEFVAPLAALVAQEVASDKAKVPGKETIQEVQQNIIELPEIPVAEEVSPHQQIIAQAAVEAPEIQASAAGISEVHEQQVSAKTEARNDSITSKVEKQAARQDAIAAQAIENANSNDQQGQLMAAHIKSDLVKKMQVTESSGLQIGAVAAANIKAGGEAEAGAIKAEADAPKSDKSSSPSPFAGIKLPHEAAQGKAGAVGNASAAADAGVTKFDSAMPGLQQQVQSSDGVSDIGKSHLSAKSQVLDQVIMRVHEGAKDGSQKVTVSLNPPELGKVEVKIDFAPDGKANLSISADSRATLDILQKHSRELERGLLDAGIKTDMGSLNFNLNGQNQNGFYANQDDFKWQGNPYARYLSDSEESVNIDPAIAAKVYSISPDAVNILV